MKLQYLIYIWLAIIKLNESKRNEKNIDDYFRLPKTVVPEHYKLKVRTFLEENNYEHISSVQINVRCIESANTITLHSRKLEINYIKLIDDTYNQLALENYSFEPKYDFLHIYLNGYLVKDATYKLKIYFTGEIRRSLAGYYRSSYKDEYGHTRWIATTKFEPTNARTAFPCFDESAMRAQFSIHLGHHPDFTALSNMPLKSTRNDSEGWVWDTFEETLKMSTYLIAYAINDFGFKSTVKSNRYGDTLIKVWAPKTSLKQVVFATKTAPKLLSFFEEYFDIAYPLPKSDFIAIPDFPSGAMENWGLITFRETKLLYLPGVSSSHDKHSIASTMAHEIAHYWFGDLVTIKWWSYLWLKEGFATYLARVAMGHLFPKKNIAFNKVLMENMRVVYTVDALATSRPVSVPIHTPQTVYEIYDGITYSKGSCVIRMMELFLGSDVMKKGLKHYLNLHQYSSTEPNDLWNSLTIVAHEDETLSKKLTVNEIMNTWTAQPGYPLIDVIRDYTSGTVTVTQRRFLENETRHDDSCFWVPLTYTTKAESHFNATKPKKWLPCPKESITFDLEDSQSWILFNVQASGLYRVNYDETNWKMLMKELEINHTAIETLNRVLLIDDIMELAMTGYIDFRIAFDFVKYIRHDGEASTWAKALDKLLTIYELLDHTMHHGLVKTYISNLLKPEFEKVSRLFKVKHFSALDLRIINAMCFIDNERCKEESLEIFLYWKQNRENFTIPVQIRSLVYCQGVKNGGVEVWEYMWKHYLQSDVAAEKVKIMDALACTEKHPLLVRYLKWMIQKDSEIRPQDAFTVFRSVIKRKKGSEIAKSFFYKYVKEIFDIQSPKGRGMKDYLRAVAYSLKNETEFDEMKTFMKENEKYFKMARITMRQLFEKFNIWKHWYKNLYPKVVQVLEEELGNKEDCPTH